MGNGHHVDTIEVLQESQSVRIITEIDVSIDSHYSVLELVSDDVFLTSR